MGGSQSREPAITANENKVARYTEYLKEVWNAPSSQEVCEDRCIKKKPVYGPMFVWSRPPKIIKVVVGYDCEVYKKFCQTINTFNPKETTAVLIGSYELLTVVPAFDREARAITNYKLFLMNFLENAVPYRKISPQGVPVSPEVVSLIDKLVDLKFDELRKKNLDTDFVIQAQAVDYYQRVWIGLPTLIDKKYVALVSSLNKSMIYHTLPAELRKIPGAKIEGSIQLFDTVFNFIYIKILQQFLRKRIITGPLDRKQEILFFNTCVKIIDDKEINKNPDDTLIEGIDIENFTDQDLKNDKIFEDLDSLKGCCKLFLFLYRKKKCTIYMTKDTTEKPDIYTFRKCKISGLEPVNKPIEEQKRLSDNEETKAAGESSAISDENRAVLDEKARKKEEAEEAARKKIDESFSNLKEPFENEVFKKVEDNLKLVLGYVLIVIVIGIIIVLSPTLFNFGHYVVTELLIPLIVYILTIIAQIVTILGKSALLTGEGLTMFVLGTISSILGMLQITTGLTSNFIKDIIVSLGQSLGIVGVVSTNVAATTLGAVGTTVGTLGKVGQDATIGSFNTLGTTLGTIGRVGQDATIGSFNTLGTTLGTIGKVGQDATIGSFNSLGTTIGTIGRVGQDATIGSFNNLGSTVGTLGRVGQDATIGTFNSLGTTIGTIGKVGQDATIGTFNSLGTTLGTFGKYGTDGTIGSFNIVGSTIGTMGKMGFDGLVGIYSTVITTSGVLTKISYDGITGALLYLMDQFTNMVKISAGSGFTIVDIVINFFSLVVKIIVNAGYGVGLLAHDFIVFIVSMLVKGPTILLSFLGKTVFENSKKFYMTINNIEE